MDRNTLTAPVLCLALLLLCASILTGCGRHETSMGAGNALFCWNGDVIGAPDELLEFMDRTGTTVLYQHIPRDDGEDAVCGLAEFGLLEKCAEAGVQVYLLTGDPSWGLDPEGKQMLEELERADSYGRGLPEEARLRGVLMDVEVYLTEEWDEDPDGTMRTWVDAMCTVRAAAQKRGLALIACIPYYLDTLGQEEELGRLLRDGCDGVAIMNYFRRDEAAHIETEMALAGGKPVTVVYELQPAGTHELTEKNTYHDLGLEGVLESVAALEDAFGKGSFSYALHHYDALKELMNVE